MPEDWEKYAVQDEPKASTDDWSQYEVKKNPIQQGSKSIGAPLNGGLNSILSSQKNITKTPVVLTEKGKEAYKEQVKAFKPQEVAKEGQPKPAKKVDSGMAMSFMEKLSDVNEGIFKIPRYIYDIAAIPQNMAADMLNMPELEGAYEDILASQGYMSPLSVIDRLGDHFKGDANQYAKRQEKFSKGIVDSFMDGNYSDGGKQILNNIAGSVPSIILMATTAGAGNAAKLGYVQKTIANALPFASTKNSQLDADETIPQHVKTINATLNGLSEVIFDQSFGTQAAISKVTQLFRDEGRDAAVKAAKDLTKGFLTNAIKKVQPLTGVAKGAAEEMTTQLSQNIVDKYTIDPDKDLMEGVLDAGVVGGVTTGGIDAVGTKLASVYNSGQKKQVGELMKQRSEIVDDLDSETLSDDIKDDLSNKLAKIDEKISNIDDQGEELANQLTEEEKQIVSEKQEKIASIEKSLQDENISETSKEILADTLLKTQDQLDEILTSERKVEEPVITEEPIIENDQKLEQETNEESPVSLPVEETVQPEVTKESTPIDSPEVIEVNEPKVEPEQSSFDELATRSLEGDSVRNTLSNVERETNTKLDKETSEYNAADFKEAFVHGENVVQKAKEEFGADYVSKFTDYVKNSKMPFENKAVMLVSLENDLRKQYLADPTNVKLKKQVDLATRNSIEHLRGAARATGVGIFRQAARANYETEQASEAIFSPKEREERSKVETAVQSTSDDIQREYEAREGVSDATIEKAVEEGVQQRIDEIYEALPSSRKQSADKAIAALEKIQKKLRSKTYDATIGVPVAIIDAGITTIKHAIKAGVKVADAIELGINKIKEKYGKDWKNEDSFRKDMLNGFSTEKVDIQEGSRTASAKDKFKQELIDAGYGKEINVKTKTGKEKRNILDWKKLTGEEGSFDRMKENLDESLKKKGYNDEQISEVQKELQEEYNQLHADIIEKSINELNRRNTPKDSTAKTLARRLAELYNLGLYDKDVDTYSNILNNALGVSPKSQEAFNQIRDFNRSLSNLLNYRGPSGKPLSDMALSTAENEIKSHMQNVIQKVQFAEGNTLFKASDVLKNVFSAMQRMLLAKIGQLIENPFSGALNDVQVKLQDAFNKKEWDTKELKEHRAMLGKAIYTDASFFMGGEYGGVGNPFTSKNTIETFVNSLSKQPLYQAFVGALSGRQYLDAADSHFKIKRTEKEFTNNLLRVLTDEKNPNGAMKHEDALKYVSEVITGQSFQDAKDVARDMVATINSKAGKEVIRSVESNIIRIANDLIKDSIVSGDKMTATQVESSFKAAYKTAGKSIGHESNNIVTDIVNATNQSIQQKLNEALKKKDWSTAALLNMTSILSKNIINPFVGGGTNWTVIGLQKMGLPTEWLRSDVGLSKKPIDLSTRQGLKELEDNLSANATRSRMYGRQVTGTLTAISALLAIRVSGDEDDYTKWLRDHPETRKLINKIQPVWLTLYLARDNKNDELIKNIASTLGSRYNVTTDQEKLFQAAGNFWKGYDKGDEKATQKGWGTVGQLMGRRANAPYLSTITNSLVTNKLLYKEFVGKKSEEQYKQPKGFTEGYFKGGMIEFMGLNDKEEEKSQVFINKK